MGPWKAEIDISETWAAYEEGGAFEATRDAVVKSLRESEWSRITQLPGRLELLIRDLGETETPDSFDNVWQKIYNLADSDRMWISTF